MCLPMCGPQIPAWTSLITQSVKVWSKHNRAKSVLKQIITSSNILHKPWRKDYLDLLGNLNRRHPEQVEWRSRLRLSHLGDWLMLIMSISSRYSSQGTTLSITPVGSTSTPQSVVSSGKHKNKKLARSSDEGAIITEIGVPEVSFSNYKWWN